MKNFGVPNANPCTKFDVKLGVMPDFTSNLVHGLAFGVRPDYTSNLVHGLAFGTPKIYITPYDEINHGLVIL